MLTDNKRESAARADRERPAGPQERATKWYSRICSPPLTAQSLHAMGHIWGPATTVKSTLKLDIFNMKSIEHITQRVLNSINSLKEKHCQN